MEGLLDGIVVLDLGRVLACPYAATMMADMGATVIKIENPKGGDDTRKMGPFVNGNSVYYANFNRGKVGVTLNLKEPEGKEIFKEMVKKADVVLENYRPGTMEKLGLGYDVLKEVNPGIVYGSISGFGHTGPLSKRAGYDIVGQAMGGLMSTTGWPDGPATRTGTPMGDVLGALNMTVGVLAALVNKQRTGKGEKVDVALVDSVAAAMENITMIYQSTGRIPQRIGNRYESTYPYDTFPAKDGDVVIAAGNNKLYAILCDVMGKPELKTDPRFAEVKDRVANHVAMREIIVPWTKQHTIDEVDKLLNDAGCPACPVNTLDRLVVDPQIAGARGMFPTIDQPGIMYGLCAGVSISAVWLSTVGPAICCIILFMLINYFRQGRREEKVTTPFVLSTYAGNVGKTFIRAIPALIMPVIIFGGIYGGIFTATEAGAAAVLYGVIFYFVKRAMNKNNVDETFMNMTVHAAVSTATICILIGFSNCSGRVISMIGIAEAIKAFVTTHISSTFGFLIFANILFLICGMLIDINAAILLIVPLLLPTAVAMGVDTIHFGAIILVNLSVGFITPPFCSSVFMAQKLSGARYVDIIKEVMPFVVASLIVVILTTYCPALSTFIPNMVAGAAA